MELPIQIVFRGIDPSPAVTADIQQQLERLVRLCDRISSCRVVIEQLHRRHEQGNRFQVRINLDVPQKELVVSHDHDQRHEHEDVYVTIRDAFSAMHRQLERYIERRADVR